MSCSCSQEPRHTIRLEAVHPVGGDTYHLDFSSETLKTWKEGDSSKLYVPIGERTPGKKFSYASLPVEGWIRFTTRLKAKDSPEPSVYKEALFKLSLGTEIEVTAPKGEFSLRREGRPVLLLSNGVGIAAVAALVKAYGVDQTGVPELVQLNVDATGEIYGDEFEALSRQLQSFISVYTKNRQGFSSQFNEVLERLQETHMQPPLFYVVGSEVFVRQTVARIEMAGYEQEDIVLDQNGGCGCSLPSVVQLIG